MIRVSADRLTEIFNKAAGAEIAVLGDVMLDRYFWGSVSRVSPEAPVPVVDIDDESFHLGGAANVASNLKTLGAKAILFGVVGNDASGKMLQQIAAQEGLDASGLAISNSRPTTVKTRVIGNNQQIVRLDRETRSIVDGDVVADVLNGLRQRTNIRCVVIEDYDKGFLSDELIISVIEYSRSKGIPVFADPKRPSLQAYRGCFLYKPNKKEAQDVLGMKLTTQEDVIAAGRKLLQMLECENILITLGAAGMMLFESNGNIGSVPTIAKHVADVSGAGDTAIATLAFATAGGASVTEAATVANIAAGVVVSEPGIVSASREKIFEALREFLLLAPEAK